MREGWLCPRCGKVNAPFISSCDCKPNKESNLYDTNNRTGYPDWMPQFQQNPVNAECEHEWESQGADSGGLHWRCKKCGETKVELWKDQHTTISSQNLGIRNV